MKASCASVLLMTLFFSLSCGDPVGIASPPTISTLFVQFTGSGCYHIGVTWTSCPDGDFSNYKLYRSESPDIQNNPASATLIQTFTSASDTSCIDPDISSGNKYYYALRTENSMKFFSWSNEESIETPNHPPASTLYVQPAGYGDWHAALNWTSCPDGGFSSYKLYRSETPGIQSNPAAATIVFTSESASETTFTDEEVVFRNDYHYALKTENSAGLNSWSNEVVFTTTDVTQFVTIPSGSFVMGSPEDEEGRYSSESPQHTVNIQTFQLMSTEVTQGLWQEVMGYNPSTFKGDPMRPVEEVSWNDCQEFIADLNYLDPDYEYRLPSESEWEYACRAGTTTRFYWGADPGDNPALIGQYAWWYGNSGSATHPVGQKLPNAWGLYDMSGNVWEWVEDCYHPNYNGAPDDGSPWVDPQGSSRVWRGGGWNFFARDCRSAKRSANSPDHRRSYLGFRLARSAR